MQETVHFRILLRSDFDPDFYGRLSFVLGFGIDQLSAVPGAIEQQELSFLQRTCTDPEHLASVGGDPHSCCAVHATVRVTDGLLGSALLVGFLVFLSEQQPDLRIAIQGGSYLTVPAVVLQAGTFSLDEALVAKTRADLQRKGKKKLLAELDQAVRRFEAGEHVAPMTVREAVSEGELEGIRISPDMLGKPLWCLFRGIHMQI